MQVPAVGLGRKVVVEQDGGRIMVNVDNAPWDTATPYSGPSYSEISDPDERQAAKDFYMLGQGYWRLNLRYPEAEVYALSTSAGGHALSELYVEIKPVAVPHNLG